MRYLILFALLATVLGASSAGQTSTLIAAHKRSDNGHPSVSDDGGLVLWTKDTFGWRNLYVMDMRTRSVQQLTTFGRVEASGAALSGDGRLVAYIAYGNVWMMSAGGGAARNVTKFTGGETAIGDVVLSHDGSKVGFLLYDVAIYDFAVLDLKTKSIRLVTNASAMKEYVYGTMSGDGRLVAFVAKRGHTHHHLWFVGTDGKNLRRASKMRAGPEVPSLDRAGTRCAFLVVPPTSSNTEVATIRTDGTQLVNVSKTPESDASPKLSTDGDRIVWVTRRSSPNPEFDDVRTAFWDGSALRIVSSLRFAGWFGGLAVNGDGSTVVQPGFLFFWKGRFPVQLWAWKDRLTRAPGSVPKPGNTVPLILQDQKLAGGTYVVRAAFSRTPGIILPGVGTVPLTADALFALSGQAPSIFQNFAGVLDAKGLAGAYVNLPNLPALKGLRFHTAAVGVKGSTTTIFNSILITVE